MREGKAIEMTDDLEGIARGNEIKIADAKVALPVVPAIVLVGEGSSQGRIFTGAGTCSVPRSVATHNAEFNDITRIVVLAQNGFGMSEGGSAPGGVRGETVVFVEQDALRTFKKHSARLSEQLANISIIDESNEFGKVVIDIGAVGNYVGSGKNCEFLFNSLCIWQVWAQFVH